MNDTGMQRKTFPAADFKATDAPHGEMEAIVAVFNNVDLGREKIAPGFFAESIANKRDAAGHLRIKGVWSHDWRSPIARTLDARELPPGDPVLPERIRALGGLWVKAQFNLQTQRGHDAFSDLEFGSIDEFSIGYRVLEDSMDAETDVRTLLRGEWFEWSPVLLGMNAETVLLSTKDYGEKPFPNEHACRLRNPGEFQADTFRRTSRRHEGKRYDVIMGRLKGETTMTEQAYRYPSGVWSAGAARSHCTEHEGRSFEPASGKVADADLAALMALCDCCDDKIPMERFVDQLVRLRDETGRVLERSATVSELRVKEGRMLSAANIELLHTIAEQLAGLATRLQELLDAAKPPSARSATAVLRLRTETERILARARALGVPA